MGQIETVTFATDAAVICNKNGRREADEFNCTFLGVEFFGPILVTGRVGEKLTDLAPEGMGMIMRGWDRND